MASQAKGESVAAASGAPLVRVENVGKRFDDAAAVVDASFTLAHGRFLTILGPSGSGKTTLLRMIAGFIEPDAGTIVIDGRAVGADPPHKRDIGMVFQRLALFPHMTAAQNVAYPLRMRKLPRDQIRERVDAYLELVRLHGLGGRRISELSGGQQQRVAIARALVFRPALLLLDEPLASLDTKLREDMQLEFRRLQQDLGVTTINVTHDQREALVMSDEVIVMDHGRILQNAAPGEAYRNPANRFVAGFIGVSNFLAGEFLSVDPAGDGCGAMVAVGRANLHGRAIGLDNTPGAPTACALRAEHVRVAHRDDAPERIEGMEMSFLGAVAEVIFEGDRLVYVVDCPSLDHAHLRVFDHLTSRARPIAAGDPVTIGWNAADLMIFPAGAAAGPPTISSTGAPRPQ